MWRKAGPSSSLAELCERRAPIWTPPKPQCGVTARVTTTSVTTTSVATGDQVTACRDIDARSAKRQGMPTCDSQRVRSKNGRTFLRRARRRHFIFKVGHADPSHERADRQQIREPDSDGSPSHSRPSRHAGPGPCCHVATASAVCDDWFRVAKSPQSGSLLRQIESRGAWKPVPCI